MEPLITITNKVLNRPRSRPRCPAGVVVAEATERSQILVVAHGLFFGVASIWRTGAKLGT